MFRNKILYLMILLECCLLCILYNAYQPVALLWIVILLPPVLYIWFLINSFFIGIKTAEEKVIVTRQSTHRTGIEIENRSVISAGQIQVKGKINGKKFLVNVYLKGRCKVKALYPVDCESCGIRNVTVSGVILFDYLKLFKRVIKINKEIKIIVVPKVYGIDPECMNDAGDFEDESENFSEIQPGDDPSEIFDIRDYETGDRLSRIHWKLSTKMNKVMVKEYSKPLPDGIVMCMDTDHGEECLDVLFSIGLFMIEEKRKVWINGALTENMEEYIMEFMRNLEENRKTVISGETYLTQGAGKGRKMICCFDSMDENKMKFLLRMAEENKIFLIMEKINSENVLESTGIQVCEMAAMDVPTAIERIMNE